MNPKYRTAYFFSDSHLHIELNERERLKRSRMLGLLEKIRSEKAMLCIVGDLFDFWFEYRHAILRDYFDILFKLRELVQDGIEVHYVAGNHDLWHSSFFEKSIGVKLYHDFFTTQVGTAQIYVKHGDGVLKKDNSYRLLKKILKNKYSVSLYRLLHPDLGVPIADFFSRQSREYNSVKEFNGEGDYHEFAQARIDEGYQYVIMGHTHHPVLTPLKGGYYINTGNWIHDFSYLILDANGPRLLRWNTETP